MWKKWWKILFKKDIFQIIDPECKPQYQSQIDKTIYRLRAQWVIIAIKPWVYIVPDSDDTHLNEVDLIEKYFLRLLKKYITHYLWSEYFISWSMALSFHLKNYGLPEKIYITNRSLSKKICVGPYEIVFKTVSWKHQWKKINLFSKLSQYSSPIELDGQLFKVAWLELSFLEAGLVSDTDKGVSFDVLNQWIKKYGNVLNTEVFYEIGKYKYAMSFNRLKEISRPLNTSLYQVFLDIIKKNGNLFIGEWLRGF